MFALANEPGVKTIDKTLEFAHVENYGFHAPRDCDESNKEVSYEKIVVWGGEVFNGGESGLSELVDKNRHSLQEIIYLPERTKGGVMIRPKYYKGDRCEVVAFPKLREMTIRLDPAVYPPNFAWETVNLQHIRLAHVLFTNERRIKEYRSLDDIEYVPDEEPLLPLATQIRSWLDTSTKFPQKVAAMYPKLEAISIALTSTKSIELGGVGALPVGAFHDWAVLYVPKPIPWEIHRLLLLGLCMSDSDTCSSCCSWRSPFRRLSTDQIGSPFMKLSHELLDERILPFLGRRNWELREFPVPETWRKELRLRPETLSDKASDMLKRYDETTAPQGCRVMTSAHVARG